jgi:hypothetical protein
MIRTYPELHVKIMFGYHPSLSLHCLDVVKHKLPYDQIKTVAVHRQLVI